MLKKMSAVLGVGLLILWIAGLGSPTAQGWLTWLDGVAALCAFAISGFTPNYASKNVRVGQPIALSGGLFALWIIGLATGAVSWLCWWTFAFACAFLALGIACSYERRPPIAESEAEFNSMDFHRSKDQTRKSA
jgi:hypothetical protein